MLARKAMLVVLNDIIGTLLGYFALYLILREFGRFEYGVLAFGLGFTGLYSILGNLGYNKANVKRVSEGKDLGTCVGTFLVVKIVLLAIFNATILLSLYVWTDHMGRGFETDRHESVILILLLYVNLDALSEVFCTTFNGRLELAKAQVSRITGNVIRLVGMIYVTTIATIDNAAELLAWTYVLGSSVELAGAMLLYKGLPISRPSMEYFRSYTKYALPALIMTSTTVITVNTDKVMLQAFWSASTVGTYASAQRVILVIGFLGNAISAVLMPSISNLHSKGKHGRILELVDQTEKYILIVSLPLVAFIVAVPDRIVYILLYNESSPVVLMILAVWVVIYVFNTPYRSLIQGWDRPDVMAKIGVLDATTNVALNLIFIPAALLGVTMFGWRAVGAAFATLIAQIIVYISIRYYGHRLANAKTHLRHLAIIPAAIALWATVYLLDSFSPALRWHHLALYFVVGFEVYAIVLMITRRITAGDISFILDVMNPFSMARYVSDEITGRDARRDPRAPGAAGKGATAGRRRPGEPHRRGDRPR